ncbi:uncharacterized protein LY89DRAFT_735515 [Mollisia scopiformis]|uniref:Uncharacterized protein n=1 Tax=Mollisia scopiformis TaxID=149040 RepID=A0A194X5F5_MOLSC|nr:uncharacterized protein LY89DRAFT_735515 [Mollisia scopiformis]KUJ15401.1 hypothetical protein LY89DRAFT_735515 [Mollisia scopiformis]
MDTAIMNEVVSPQHHPSTSITSRSANSTSAEHDIRLNKRPRDVIAPVKTSRKKLRMPKFPWEKLPFELREKIFEFVSGISRAEHKQLLNKDAPATYFKRERGSHMPALIVALRPLATSYHHVLQWF